MQWYASLILILVFTCFCVNASYPRTNLETIVDFSESILKVKIISSESSSVNSKNNVCPTKYVGKVIKSYKNNKGLENIEKGITFYSDSDLTSNRKYLLFIKNNDYSNDKCHIDNHQVFVSWQTLLDYSVGNKLVDLNITFIPPTSLPTRVFKIEQVNVDGENVSVFDSRAFITELAGWVVGQTYIVETDLDNWLVEYINKTEKNSL